MNLRLPEQLWLNLLLLDRDHSAERDEVLSLTNQSGYMTRPAWVLMHRLPMYAQCPRMDISTAEDIEARLINIPRVHPYEKKNLRRNGFAGRIRLSLLADEAIAK